MNQSSIVGRISLVAACVVCAAASDALAQRGGNGARGGARGGEGRGANPPSTVFKNARIISGSGDPIESGTLEVVRGAVRQLGKDLTISENATVVDAAGMTITPGLIDVDGTLGVSFVARGGNPDPTNRAFDNFDRYAIPVFKDAVRNGVTSLYISPRTGNGITGLGAVVRLKPGDGPWAGTALKDEAALCIDLGSGATPTQRLDILDKVRRQFRSAVDHREAVEAYKEDLEDYEKKIKERAEKEKKEGDKKEGDKKGAGGSSAPEPPGSGDAKPPEGGQQGEKKEDEIKKPIEPRPDRGADVLLRALDRQLPVRVRCERSEDIFNALDLAKEFSLNVIIEGGTEAYLVAPRLAVAKAPVVLGSSIGRDFFDNDEFHRRDVGGVEALERSGVKWLVGTGHSSSLQGTDLGEPSATRFVLPNAQLLAAHADDRVDPLGLVTADAADFLGVSDKIGRLRPGMEADFVLWSGDPLDPAARVREVYIGGELVYRADEAKAGEGGHP